MEMIELLIVGFIIFVLSYGITTRFVCGTSEELCISAYTYSDEYIHVFEWHGLYYAESWCKGKYVGFIRKRTRFALTKDKALALAQLDIQTAHAMSAWNE